MILDDGGDLTNLVHDKYPELLKGIRGMYLFRFARFLGPPSFRVVSCATRAPLPALFGGIFRCFYMKTRFLIPLN
jgi:hypothetical protein